jgi:hypothetical protein
VNIKQISEVCVCVGGEGGIFMAADFIGGGSKRRQKLPLSALLPALL